MKFIDLHHQIVANPGKRKCFVSPAVKAALAEEMVGLPTVEVAPSGVPPTPGSWINLDGVELFEDPDLQDGCRFE